MITLDWRSRAQEFEANLHVKAELLGRARGQLIAASRRDDGAGWRNAPFLWPLIERN